MPALTGKNEPVRCCLCGGVNTSVLETLRAADIVRLYRRQLRVDVAAEFGEVTEIEFRRCADCDLRFFTPRVTGSEKMYESLQRYSWYYLDEKEEYAYAAQFIGADDSVLEIGCGKGAFGKRLQVSEYVGLEFSVEAARMAQAKGLRVLHESVQDHARRNTGRYDVVCAFQVLEHVSDCADFISASLACVKPGGLLIYSVPSSDSFLAVVANNMLNMPPHHITWWSDRCLTGLANRCDMSLVALGHDKLADLHRRTYLIAVLLRALRGKPGTESRILNPTTSFYLLSKFAALGARFLERGFSDRRVLPDGHSVTAIYRKCS
jgi:SAM-dependent methyltransferase